MRRPDDLNAPCGLMTGMANPAQLLFEHLSLWASSGKPNQAQARGLTDGTAGWVEQRHAVKNLEHLETVIQEMKAQGKKVDVEEAYLPRWTQAVFAYPLGWSDSKAFIQDTTLLFLQQTAHRLDDLLLPVADGAPEDMLMAADEVEEAVAERTDLPAPLRLLVMESVSFLKRAVDEYEITGEFVLNQAVQKFIRALELLEKSDPKDPKIRKVKARIARWYKSPLGQLVLAGIISAEMAEAVPALNEAATDSVSAVTQLFELPPATKSESQAELEPIANTGREERIVDAEEVVE